jgi:hypothetical protein
VVPALSSILVALAGTLLAVLGGRQYLRRVRVDRPPIGVFNLRDLTFVFTMLVLLPPLYLHLPRWLVGAVLVLVSAGVVYLTLAPLVRGRPPAPAGTGRPAAGSVAAGLAAVAVATAEVALVLTGHAQSAAFTAINDAALLVIVVGVTNIWAQSGLRAGPVAAFGTVVAGYDLLATWFLPLMTDFFTHLQALPFAPTMGWGNGPGSAGIGLGDLLFVVLWPLVAEKAYSAAAGRVAAFLTVGCVTLVFLAFRLDLVNRAVPAMAVIGPVIVAHYWWLRRRQRTERTTGEYEAARHPDVTPPIRPPAWPPADLQAALALLDATDATDATAADAGGPRRYLAVHQGRVIATGASAGQAVRAARLADPGAVPVLTLSREQPEPDA